MPYTAAQLTQFFATDNGGVGPDSAASLLFATYAQQDSASLITDLQAVKQTLQTSFPASAGYNAPASTTDVALSAYEYLTGSVPSAAGLTYLLDHVGTGLTTSAYAGLNQETRYENLMIDLAMAPSSSASAGFAATYGGLTFNQAVQVAYEKIVGLANVGATRDAAAIADITSRQAYFTAVAAESPTLNQPLTAIAAMIGYVLHEAVKADVGTYAVAMDNFNFNLATGGTVNYGSDITTSYPSTSPYAGPPAGQQLALTTAVDSLAGGGGNDVISGTYSDGGVGGGNTFNIGDRVTGGGGSDTLTISPNLTVGAGSPATTLPDTLWTSISGIGNLSVSTNAGALNLTAGPAFNAAFANGLVLTLNTGAGAITLDLGGSGATAFSGTALIVANTSGGGAQSITAGSGATGVTANAFSGAQTVIGSNLTTVSLTNSGAGAQTLTSTGSGAVTATVVGVSGVQTINTAGGDDTLNVTTSAGATNFIATGAGADTITLSSGGPGAHNTIVAGAGADRVNLGSHAGSVDTLTYVAGDSSAGSLDIITNMTTTDLLSFPSTASLLADGAYTAAQTGVANLTATETSGILTFGGSAAAGLSASTAIAAAVHLAGLSNAAGTVDAFVLGNATYVVEFNAVTPIVVELVGVTATALGVAGATVHFI
jgi:hypothetical protein